MKKSTILFIVLGIFVMLAVLAPIIAVVVILLRKPSKSFSPEKSYKITTFNGNCLTSQGGQGDCSDGFFNVIQKRVDIFNIKPFGTTLCLDKQGEELISNYCSETTTQEFDLLPIDDKYNIKHVSSGKCLEATANSIIFNKCNNSKEQKFNIKSEQPPPKNPEKCPVGKCIRDNSGKCSMFSDGYRCNLPVNASWILKSSECQSPFIKENTSYCVTKFANPIDARTYSYNPTNTL